MNGTITTIAAIIERELRTLRAQIEACSDERDLWRVAPGIANPPGVLAAHLVGNLQHFIGARLGGTGFVRDRDAEFARRDRSRAELLAAIDETRGVVRATLAALPEYELDADYPDVVGGVRVTTGDLLVHLISHLAYHLGQIDYHRRLLAGGGALKSVPVQELATARPT
jgi:uncharacterized damage-inducible protein DinB